MAKKTPRNSKLSALGLIGGQTIFLIIFCIFIVAVADKSELNLDWSLSSNFSLHPATERLCADIQTDIRIYGIWPKNPKNAYNGMLRSHKNIDRKLDIIANSNTHIQYTQLDPELDKPRIKALEEQYGELNGPAVFIANTTKKALRIPYTFSIAQTLENNIGSALLALESNINTKIYILKGHGELVQGGGDHNGIDYLLRILKTNGYEVIILDPAKLSALQRIPKDGVLFIPGARSPLGSQAITAVREFMQDGGNALILADHRCPQDLSTLLRQRGILIGNGFPSVPFSAAAFQETAPVGKPQILCSAEQSLVGNEGRLDRLQILPNQTYVHNVDSEQQRHFLVPQNHPCTSRSHYSGRYIVSPFSSSSLALDPEKMDDKGEGLGEIMNQLGTVPYRITRLISMYGNNIWPAHEKNSQLLNNPLADNPPQLYTLAYAFEYKLSQDTVVKDSTSRMVIWSSRQAASNLILKQGTLANELFILDSLAWLDFRENSSNIPPSTFNSFKVECSDETLRWVMILLVIIIPMLSLGGAILTWWDRR